MTAVDRREADPRAPTIYDVAAAAGVSHTTVSRAINGEEGMTDATRRRVLEIVARVRFTPNLSARVLAGRVGPRLAAVMVGGAGCPRAAALVGAIARATERRGLALTMIGADPSDEGSMEAAAQRIGEPGLRGVVFVLCDGEPAESIALLRTASPWVSMSVHPGAIDDGPDDHAAAALRVAVDHLRDLGHDAIACALPATVVDRVGRRSVTPLAVPATARGGLRVARRGMLPHDCTAVVVPSLSFALGLVSGLRARGVRVPQDLSLVSLEDHPDAAHFSPPVSAVDSGLADRAERAVSRLLDGAPAEAPAQLPRLVLRGSSRTRSAQPIDPPAGGAGSSGRSPAGHP
ncbi:LacI family DNA-binding transcriptional regulator [Microbacterium sp. HJ5]